VLEADIMALPLNPFALLKPMPTGHGMVIIAGMQKSGTTAIAMLLGAATGQTVCSDPFYRLSEMKVDFRKELYEGQLSLRTLWRRHRRVFTGTIIKDPNFVLLLPQIREMLPDAQIVFIVRDPRDTIRSILNRLALPGKPQGVDLESVDIPVNWRKLLLGQIPKIPGKDYVEVLAWRWRMSVEAFLEYRDVCVEIRYEDFKKNKSSAISEMARQLGYAELCSFEHLVDIQYQPKGDADVHWGDFFGEKQLAVIDRVTAPVAAEFGYAITHPPGS
jgi:hypothetical protein